MRRKPPDILVTTPESLYLIMTSGAREILTGAEAVIVDEIHAVAQSKRGAHLALTLERLSHLVRANGGADVQRIGLSATQRPLERIARFLAGPRRDCEIADAGKQKELDLEIVVPVEDMTEPDASIEKRRDGGDADFDGASNTRSIWPAIYPELLKLVREHTSTIIFVNNRRGAERLAKRLNELANEEEWQELPATEQAGAGATVQDSDPAAPSAPEPAGNAAAGEASGGVIGDCPRPPRLARPRGTPGGRGAAEVGAAPLPGGHLVAGARDRHGRRRSGDPGRVAEVRDPRPPADRAGWPYPRRGLRGAHLPEVPRRPARVRGGRPADARGGDRGDGDPPQPARRARSAPGLHVRRRRVAGGRGRAPGHRAPSPSRSSPASSSRTSSTCSTGATRPTASPSCGRGWSGTARPGSFAAGPGPGSSPSPTPARFPTAASMASTCRMAAGWESSTRRWSTRPAPARLSCSAPPPGGSRRSRATG